MVPPRGDNERHRQTRLRSVRCPRSGPFPTVPPRSDNQRHVRPVCKGFGMDTTKVLRGIELRYVLTRIVANGGEMTVADILYELDRQGFSVGGRPSKTVSDTLRWEVRLGRVSRWGRDRYGPGVMPSSTEYRIRQRVAALRIEANTLRAECFDDWGDDQIGA